jgi:membrane protease YdiL (CAAX protease family)
MTNSLPSRVQLLKLAIVFQGGLLLAALVWGKWLALPWENHFAWNQQSLLAGLIATVPLTLFLYLSLYVRWEPFLELKDLLLRRMGPLFAQLSVADIVLISLLAGVSEEVFFRGAMQFACSDWGFWPAVVATNLVFGLCHALSAVYFVMATLAGFYLSLVAGRDEQNLVSAIVAHAAYDFLALLVIVRRARQEVRREVNKAPGAVPPSPDAAIPDQTGENSAISREPEDKLGELGTPDAPEIPPNMGQH